MIDPPPQVSAKWVQRNGKRHIHVTATRGVVSTEATLTEGEARELVAKVGALLAGPPPMVDLLYAREGDPLQYAYKPGTDADPIAEPYAPTAETVATFVAPETGWYEIPGFRKLEDAEVKARGLP